MSLQDDLYPKRQWLADRAQCDAILRKAREAVCDGKLQGLQLIELERQVAATRKLANARWASMGRWFAALANAKREWNLRVFGEHDAELYRKIAFLKHVVALLLDGMPKDAPTSKDAIPSGTLWARERTQRDLARGFMPDCPFEICTGGCWRPVQREQLPDRVRWV